MPVRDYDLLIVGGGLGGASLAKVMAGSGARVLVLEREPKFRDRVRGEFLAPWGLADAQQLAIAELLQRCGCDVRAVETGLGQPRDLRSTTPQALPALGFSHPEMQETLLQAAETAGAQVRRGVLVTTVEPGDMPRVHLDGPRSNRETITARLVVAADGRNSAARQWPRFTVARDLHPFLFAGVLLSDLAMPLELAHYFFNPALAMIAAIAYQGANRFRAYLAYPVEGFQRLQGEEAVPRFLEYSRRATAFSHFYEGPDRAIGPLASFSCDEDWVEHPYRDGVALIGDAAATSDPAYGQGMALTLRDVRTLSEKLLSKSDRDAAGDEYASEHDQYFAVIHRSCTWLRQVFQDQGPEADARRARAMPLIAEDPTRVPDHIMSGPELPCDDDVRARFFGEQV